MSFFQKKMFLLSLAVFLCATFTSVRAAAGEQNLQPKALDIAGIYALKQNEPNLTGAGVKFALICRSLTYIDGKPQNDYRPYTHHNCFANQVFNFHDDSKLPASISAHSTAICSILFGFDPDAYNSQVGQFTYQGITADAQANIYEFWYFLTNNVFRNSPVDADILTASIGSQFEDWWTRGIESLVQRYGLIVVAGIGNGTDAYDPPLYPAAGSNVIGVGVVDSVNTEDSSISLERFSLAYPNLSSFGPTEDNRCKPDIVAPGNSLTAGLNEPNSYEPTGSWSSFSTPIVAGTVGLLLQKAKQTPGLAEAVSPDGGNCVIKAILMNSAKKLPYWHKGKLTKADDHLAPLDYIQGAGMLNAAGAYEHLIAGSQKPGSVSKTGWDLNSLKESETTENGYQINVPEPNNKLITATVVWNKHYNNIYPFKPTPEKDANLRLQVWAVNANNELLLDYSDSINDNVEHIHVKCDSNYTDYEIVISYSDVNDQSKTDIPHHYGLAWNVSNKSVDDNIHRYDINADGIVDELDLVIILKNSLNHSDKGYLFGDINNDGLIDFADLKILSDHKNTKADWNKENKFK